MKSGMIERVSDSSSNAFEHLYINSEKTKVGTTTKRLTIAKLLLPKHFLGQSFLGVCRKMEKFDMLLYLKPVF